jgi:hypothetical protein
LIIDKDLYEILQFHLASIYSNYQEKSIPRLMAKSIWGPVKDKRADLADLNI